VTLSLMSGELTSEVPSSFGDLLRCDAARLAAKVPDDVIGDRRKLGIRISWTEWRHVNVLVFDSVLRAVQHDLSYITASGICHRPAADQRRIDRLPAIAVVLMAVYASTFENLTAEFVLRLLRSRRARSRFRRRTDGRRTA
jgi:hypothetical protein